MPEVSQKHKITDELVIEAVTYTSLLEVLYEDQKKEIPLVIKNRIMLLIEDIRELRIDSFLALKEKNHEDLC